MLDGRFAIGLGDLFIFYYERLAEVGMLVLTFIYHQLMMQLVKS